MIEGQILCNFLNAHIDQWVSWFREHGYAHIDMEDLSQQLIRETFPHDSEKGPTWGWIVDETGVWFPTDRIEAAIEVLTIAGWIHRVGKGYDFWESPIEAQIAKLKKRIVFLEERSA